MRPRPGGWVLALAALLALPACPKKNVPAPEPVPDAGPAPEPPRADAGSPDEGWTTGPVTQRRDGMRPVVLRAVRAARNEGFDRVVFEFDGPAVPGYTVEAVSRPTHACGSGNEVEIGGQALLRVALVPAQAHDDNGQPTVVERERKPGLPVLREMKLTCDFEADVTWVLGLERASPFRVQELSAPARLVVDLRHGSP